MNGVTRGFSTGQLTIDLIIFPQHHLMNLSNKCFSQRFIGISLLLDHIQTDIMSFHLLKVFHFGRAYYFSEKKEHFCLAVSECITLNMIAVIIKVERKLSLQPFFVIRRKGAEGLTIVCKAYQVVPYL